jgi:hypothetical protein
MSFHEFVFYKGTTRLWFTKTKIVIFPAVGRNPTRGVSWSRVTSFSILDFLIGFPNFFKLSPKILYIGSIYPKNWGHIDTSWKFSVFFTPLTPVKETKIGPRIFFGARKVPGGFKMGLQRKNFACGFWANGDTNLKFCRAVHTINIGPRNFIQPNLSTGWAFISNFPKKVWNFPHFRIRVP